MRRVLGVTRAQVVNVVKGLFGVHIMLEYVVDVHPCAGPSMFPTLYPQGDLLVNDRLTHRLGRLPQRGDLLVLASPQDPSRTVCKRVLGLGGDTVVVDPTAYLDPSASTKSPDVLQRAAERVKVPPGHVWVVGDNASNSADSRVYGPVPHSLVRGRVIARIWPTFTSFVHPTTPVAAA